MGLPARGGDRLFRPGKPTDNAYIEAFNSRLRAECLNASWFLSMADASRLPAMTDDQPIALAWLDDKVIAMVEISGPVLRPVRILNT